MKSCRRTLTLSLLFFWAFCLYFCSLPLHGGVPTTIGQNFTGSSFGTDSAGIPPDANGAIGPQDFVEFINGSFAAYNKTNPANALRLSDVDFWFDAGVTLPNDAGIADPRIIYDPTIQRWFASMVDFNAGTLGDPTLNANNFLLAVSDSADPRGTWHGWRGRADPVTGFFADFPTLGVDSNAVYLAADMFHGELSPEGSLLISFPKGDLLLASTNNRTSFGVMPYAQRGDVLQPAVCFDGGSSGKILATSDIGNDSDPHSNLVCFAVQNAGGPGATLSSATFIPTASWEVPDSPYLPAPCFHPIQPDGTDTLQANEARFSSKVYSVGGILYAVHNTDIDGRIAIRWYRVRAADNVLLESGTIADTNLDLFFPSIAVNPYGVVVIAFNGCSINTFISIYAMVGQTINGVTTFGDRILLKASTLSYHGFDETFEGNETSRWGDYSATSVDPSDPNRFWTIQMYANPDDLFDSIWSTQITELITPRFLLSIKPLGTNVVLSWPTIFSAAHLQSATNLASPTVWSNVTQTGVTNGDQLSVTLPAFGARKFFRLQQ